MVNKSIHRTNQFRIPCPQCTHSILVTEKPQAMFAAFQILSFERSGIADQLHKNTSPRSGRRVQMSRKQKRIGHSIAAAHSNDFAALQRQKAVFPYNISPRFHSSAERARLRVTACRPSFPPSDRRRPLRTPDFRLPAIRPTFILRPFRTNLSTPKIKKVANECLQPSRPPGRLRREGDSNPDTL